MRLKKLVLVGMAVLSIAAVSACTKKSDTKASDATEKTETTATTETTGTAETKTAQVEQPDDYGTVELGNYIGVEIPNIDTKVTDEEVQAQIDTELKQDPDVEEVTGRPVQDGDTVNIDYTN